MKPDGHRLVHLDLKGAPPKISYLEKLFPFLKCAGATGILIEYEDTFPYWGDLKILAQSDAYSISDVEYILQLAKNNDFIIIPLVQTFGHLEFVLKHERFRHLREIENYPNVLCPSHPESHKLIEEMITQILQLHPQCQWLHIGADEVWHLAHCTNCEERMESRQLTKEQVFLHHLKEVARFARSQRKDLSVIAWDDMMRTIDQVHLRAQNIGSFIEPMVWSYLSVGFHLADGMWNKYCEIFSNVWGATAFKGASGPAQCLPDIKHHLNNHVHWLMQMKEQANKFHSFRGIVLTGWQRYDHYSILCELLPCAIPSLVICLQTLIHGEFNETVHRKASSILGSEEKIDLDLWPRPRQLQVTVSFPGCDLYLHINGLINEVFLMSKLKQSDSFIGWFSTFNVKCRYANPLQLEFVERECVTLCKNMDQLKYQIANELSAVYHEKTVKEWLMQHMEPSLAEIHTILKNVQSLISEGTRPEPEFPM